MLKKVIPIVVVLCLMFGISAMAENTSAVTDGAVPGVSQQMPQGERPQGERGNMGTPPSGGMQGRTPPGMPDGEMPQGEFTPPEGFTPPDGEFTPPQNASEFTPPQGEFNPQQNGANQNSETAAPPAIDGAVTENEQTQENGEESNQTQGENQQFGGRSPVDMGNFPGNMQNFNGQTQEEQPKGFLGFVKTYSTPITSVILLGLAFIFVIFYRRKNY